MRIRYATTAHCAHLAKALRREISPHIPSVTLSACHNAVGQMMGYRNWQELAAHARPGVVESPPDDDVPAAEACLRAALQVGTLRDRMGLSHAVAEAIVSKVRPTGRRIGGVAPAQPAWRSNLKAMMASPGLPGLSAEYVEHLLGLATDTRGIQGPVWRVGQLEGFGEVRIMVRTEPGTDEGFRVDEIRAVHLVDGRIVVSMDGYVVAPTAESREECHLCWASVDEGHDDPGTDEIVAEVRGRLFTVADDAGSDIAAAVARMSDDGSAYRLLMGGNVFVLTDVRRDPVATAKGQGAAFVAAVMAVYNARRKGRIRSLAAQVDPEGYGGLGGNARRASRDWLSAREHLTGWLLGAPAIRAVLGEGAEIVVYDTGPGIGNDPTGLPLAMGRSGPDDQDEVPGQYPMGRTVSNTMRLSAYGAGSEVTPTEPGEPRAFKVGEYPEGFDVVTAACFPRVAPHPDLWAHMPSELVSLKVVPREAPGAMGRQGLGLVARFENGTELAIPEEYLPGGGRYMVGLPELTTVADTFVTSNHYAPRMTAWDMQMVLTINGMLLFDGVGAAPGGGIPGPVEVRRPDLMPRVVARA